MDWLTGFLQTILHLDDALPQWAAMYGTWIYGILFLIVFCETGLVVTPFLPGDSLLFAAGAVSAAAPEHMNVHLVVVLLIVAAVIGDGVNYSIGAMLGDQVREGNRFIKKEHLERTHAFYEKYGAKTIILARFVPIVRTFAPFVAGVGRMTYAKFATYNVVGAIIWVTSLTYAGYGLGNVPFVKKNFEIIVLAIIFLSILPGIVELIRARRAPEKLI
ncbi:MAG TPA: DedA family protein [Candidatus Limnocylindrales bacterium]|nr:DedA family protein [Candidatus Limnocylindrales bacterium]